VTRSKAVRRCRKLMRFSFRCFDRLQSRNKGGDLRAGPSAFSAVSAKVFLFSKILIRPLFSPENILTYSNRLHRNGFGTPAERDEISSISTICAHHLYLPVLTAISSFNGLTDSSDCHAKHRDQNNKNAKKITCAGLSSDLPHHSTKV
jgi:hypothetical protein